MLARSVLRRPVYLPNMAAKRKISEVSNSSASPLRPFKSLVTVSDPFELRFTASGKTQGGEHCNTGGCHMRLAIQAHCGRHLTEMGTK